MEKKNDVLVNMHIKITNTGNFSVASTYAYKILGLTTQGEGKVSGNINEVVVNMSKHIRDIAQIQTAKTEEDTIKAVKSIIEMYGIKKETVDEIIKILKEVK